MKSIITSNIKQHLEVIQFIQENTQLLESIEEAATTIINSYKQGGKLLLCGNGGSASDAQHIAAELSGRYLKNRPPLFAEALHVNTSFVTAVGNDFGYDAIYARAVEAMGKSGDVLIAISTSGNSTNILNAIQSAKLKGMIVIGMSGELGGNMQSECDIMLNIPSNSTPRIQEAHILCGHILCEIIENQLFN